MAASTVLRSPSPKLATYEVNELNFKGECYTAKVQRMSGLSGNEDCPPLVCIPPVGVGITREFYEPLHREWAALGAPSELHTPDLLGCGDAKPKRRRFYTPEFWAVQLLDYIQTNIKVPVIVVSQGGLLPVALEMWRAGGTDCIAGVSFVSPPPLRFFAPEAAVEPGVRSRFTSSADAPGRRTQRLLWLLSQSTIGNAFYRYLRFGKGQPRIRSFSERNLFAAADAVDDEWMEMCYKGSRDSKGRFATLAYLCGTVPGGAWRDDRAPLLASLDVPTQVLRGDVVEGAETRLAAFVERVPNPSCCSLVAGGRAVIPYENAQATAQQLARFLAAEFDAKIPEEVERSARESTSSYGSRQW